ncbi:N-acetyltransferase family protein [Comamonas sp. 4034]|uniref:GNAT family N-acetyltransferase n=1 Tax=Comamonas sp. 4034 TaxID=3156455 RepID=UPI003D19CC88
MAAPSSGLISGDVVIRWIGPEDAPAFQALRLSGLREAPTAFGSSYAEEKDEPVDAVRQRLVQSDGQARERGILGAFVSGQLVGTMGIRLLTSVKLRHQLLIWGVYVSPQHRGGGIARAMLAEALSFARTVPGALLVKLSVNAGNHAALRLYQTAGFSVYGTEPAALCIDGELHDEHLMQRWLHAAPGQ